MRLEAGKLEPLSLRVHRILAPNPGMMTGPGTNTYLIGNRRIAVIDPGPCNPQHIDVICAAVHSLQGQIQWILCTHTHMDHSPGAALLKAECPDAQVLAMPAPGQGYGQDDSFQLDLVWQHHNVLMTDEFSLLAIHTPGHASNHLCYLVQEEGLLCTGDHIMNGSTVVIAPPDGNMQHYLDSLNLLKNYPIKRILPGHGDVLDNPLEVIEGTLQHRLMRERKVLERLAQLQPCDITTLTGSVYDEVPVFLHPMARLSLLAHLQKLHAEGRVTVLNDEWREVNS
jgi:glyoxylase-like metal-dependent hydrolase (beta-lactamase superfamily II)